MRSARRVLFQAGYVVCHWPLSCVVVGEIYNNGDGVIVENVGSGLSVVTIEDVEVCTVDAGVLIFADAVTYEYLVCVNTPPTSSEVLLVEMEDAAGVFVNVMEVAVVCGDNDDIDGRVVVDVTLEDVDIVFKDEEGDEETITVLVTTAVVAAGTSVTTTGVAGTDTVDIMICVVGAAT